MAYTMSSSMWDKQPWFSWQRRAGEPIRIGSRELTPVARVLIVRWPNGGLVINRPVAIRIRQEGKSTQFEVTDVQFIVRISLLVLFGVYLLAILLRLRAFPKKRSQKYESRKS